MIKNPTIKNQHVFLTPLELVLAEKILKSISTKISRAKLQITFLLCCLSGFRLKEVSKLQLGDFVRDPKTGLLCRDEKNRAIMYFPAKKTMYGAGSYPYVGTVLVPHVADVIDDFLKSDAMSGAPDNAYLIHKGKHWSLGKANEDSIHNFFQRNKSELSKALVNHPKGTTFSQYDLRRTCYGLLLDLVPNRSQKVVQIHLRQKGVDIKKLRAFEVEKSKYYDPVLHALGFPWEEKEVKEWMQEKGYADNGELKNY